jgi:hypothetical protein
MGGGQVVGLPGQAGSWCAAGALHVASRAIRPPGRASDLTIAGDAGHKLRPAMNYHSEPIRFRAKLRGDALSRTRVAVLRGLAYLAGL